MIELCHAISTLLETLFQTPVPYVVAGNV